MYLAPAFEELLSRIALAFGIGLLIGLERGWSTREMQPGSRVAGIRTFGISGLLGGLVAAMAAPSGSTLEVGGALLIGLAFATFSSVFIVFNRDASLAGGNHSATGVVAALLTFMLGAYAVLGDRSIAAAAAVSAAGVLAFREGIHRWVARITRRELESGLALLAMSFIALPIVPDRAIGPFGGVNLRQVWIIAIVLAAFSFAGYAAVRYFGERRGELVSAAVGGVISSTAVTISNARRVWAGQGSASLLAAATALATAVSFIRVTAISCVLSPNLLLPVGLPLLVASTVAVAYAWLRSKQRSPDRGTRTPVEFRNPFGFWTVLAMAALMSVLVLAGRLLSQHYGKSGIISGAVAMGLVDVDAMTVSMARLASDTPSPQIAGWAILCGVGSNTALKVVIASALGRGRFALHVAAICIACSIAAASIVVLS